MKSLSIIVTAILAAMLHQASVAQTGSWKAAGNTLTGTQKLGSINNFPVNFYSNNINRMSLTAAGNLKINSDQSSIQFSNAGITAKPMIYLYESGSINSSRMVLAYSPGFPTYGLQYNQGDRFDFLGNGTSVLDINLATRKVGVGTIAPAVKLHVVNGSSGALANFNTTLALENSTSNYLSLLAPNANESGVLFGNPSSSVSGGIIYNNASSAMQFRTAGNLTHMVLTGQGLLGLGNTTDPGVYRMRIDDDQFGLDIANSKRFTDWEFFTELNLLQLFGNGNFKGSFNMTDGAYTAVSDERLKTNIQPMGSMLDKIMQLKPVSYQFKNTGKETAKNASGGQQQDGFLAQDVHKIFPGLVVHNVNEKRKLDVYSLNYSGFGVIAIKGIQELIESGNEKTRQLESQQQQINQLQKQLDELKAIVLNNSSTGVTSGIISSAPVAASVDQNMPNPFRNTTSVQYTLPGQYSSAQLIITDNSGKTVKQTILSGKGRGTINIDATSLAAGTYRYSLMVDGKITNTRLMMVTK